MVKLLRGVRARLERLSDAELFLAALAARAAFTALFLLKGLGDVYGRDLYFSLAQSWLGWTPMPAFGAPS